MIKFKEFLSMKASSEDNTIDSLNSLYSYVQDQIRSNKNSELSSSDARSILYDISDKIEKILSDINSNLVTNM
jgi:hypothetical protein